MKIAFIITTYNIPNLNLSLPALERYVSKDRFSDNNYYLLINNDNPNICLNENYVRSKINTDLLTDFFIRNTEENEGCLNARISSIDTLRMFEPDWFMFIDDDDVILNPTFNCNDPQVYNISHRAVVTHRLLEVLSLIDNPSNLDLNNPYIEYEEWKMGCVGIPYRYNPYYRFIQTLKGFLPRLYELYGSKRVMEPDDVILMNLWNVWLSHVVGEGWIDKCFMRANIFSYSLTYLEDRKGRYFVEPGIIDLRYGDRWDGVTTYRSIIEPMINDFDIYMHQLNKVS